MALASNLSLTTLFGANASLTGSHPNTFVNIKISDLGTFTDTAGLSAEGILLAILQYANSVQGSDVARVLDVSSSNILISRGGDLTYGESTTARIFSSSPVDPVDPDDV